ncbi:unnamed protein product, partial [Prunus brigantina]
MRDQLWFVNLLLDSKQSHIILILFWFFSGFFRFFLHLLPLLFSPGSLSPSLLRSPSSPPFSVLFSRFLPSLFLFFLLLLSVLFSHLLLFRFSPLPPFFSPTCSSLFHSP